VKLKIGIVAILVFSFLFLAIFSSLTSSVTQQTFYLDLDNPVFNFTENQLSPLNGSKNTLDILFSRIENQTAYIRIPKNSTILYSNITLRGQMTPIQSLAGGSQYEIVWDIVVDNVNYSLPYDEIVVGTSNPAYVKLLNNTGGLIWSYGMSTAVYAVSTGNLSSDEGKEILAGDSSKIVCLNSNGNVKWNKTIGTVNDIEVKDVREDFEYDEIAVATGQRIYLLNSSGGELWNSSFPDICNGVGIGNLSSDQGEEIVGACGSYIYVLNSTGSILWSKDIGNTINDVDVSEANPNSDYDEIAIALTNGTFLLLDYQGDLLWSFDTQDKVDTIKIGEVTSDEGNEIVAGSVDDSVYVLSSSGSLIWSYKTQADVGGVGIGNLSAVEGNEVAVGTSAAPYNLYILNFEYYPTNPWLDIGNDTIIEWNYSSGKFRGEAWVSNNSAFQNYLSICTPDNDGSCDIPLIFHSDFAGDLNITSINITFQYNISDIISSQTVPACWSRTDNIWVNESVGNEVKNITYSKNPAVSVSYNSIKVNSSATKCDFNGKSYPVTSGVCTFSPAVQILSTRYDILWDDTMSTGKPVLMNESEGVFEGGFWKKSLMIWNTTSTNITNVFANTTLSESVTGYSTLKVDWYDNGTFYNITPATSSGNCNSSNPTFSSIKIGNDTFSVCMQDLDGNGVIDYFVWKQPFTKGYTRYEVSGSANHVPELRNITVIPAEGIWGTEFNISVNVTDVEGDNVTVRLYVYYTKTFNLTEVNFSQIVWQFVDEKNTTQNTTEGEILVFNLTSTKEMTGINLFRLGFKDFNSSTQTYYHDEHFTLINYGPNVTKHNVSLTHIQGNDTSVNRTETTLLVVQVNDLDFGENASEVNCTFWVWLNDTHKDWGNLTQSNLTGYCNYYFTPNGSYVPGQRKWNVTIDDRYYNLNVSQDYLINIYGKLNLNLTEETLSQNATRNSAKVLTAKLFDEFGQIVRIADYNCSWYINGINRTFENLTKTNESGYCTHTWLTNCTDDVGIYPINVTLTGNVNPFYLLNKTQDIKNITLKDNLNITIISPQAGSIFHPNDTIIYLNSSITDYCNLRPSHPYNVNWKTNLTNEGVSPPPGETISGENVTLNIASYPPGLLNITISSAGDLYNLAEKNTSVWIYGRSAVNVTYPKNNQIYEKTETIRTLNISCLVFNYDIPDIIIERSNITIWNDSTYLTSGTTNVNGTFNYTWNISELPDGNYTITCGIDKEFIDPTNWYMRYHAIKQNDTVAVIIREKDTMPPEILSISVNSTTPGNNVTIEARIIDWYGVDASWINLTYPNGTSQIIALRNTTPYLINTIWKTELVNLTQVGDYDFILYANDSSANVSLKPCIEDVNHTSCKFAWFEIYLPIQLYINATYDVDFTFFRPGTNLIIHSFKNQTGNYNYTLHKRVYDFEAKFVDRYNQKHSIKFNSFDSTATAQAQNSTNITNPLNLSDIDVRWVRVRPDYDDRHLAVIKIQENMIYSNVTLTFDYSKSLEGVRYEPAIRIFKCSDWNETGFSCISGWQELAATPNLVTHTISITQTSASVYAVVEKGSALLLSPGGGYTGPTGGFAGGGGGGGGGYSSYCGNRICDIGENPENCPEDCGPPFTVKTNLTDVYLLPEEVKKYALSITNRLDKEVTLSISATGPLKGLVHLENKVTIPPLSNLTIPISVFSPKETGTYTGLIIVENSKHREELPVTINVLERKYMPALQISLEILTKRVEAGSQVNFKVTYDTTLKKRIDTKITYSLIDGKSRSIILEATTKKILEGSSAFLDNITLPKNISFGTYFIRLTAAYDEESVSAIDSFEVIVPILTAERIRQLIIISLAILSVALILYGRKKYLTWKAIRARYIFPIDLKSLPKGNLWLGKIAETNIKATFDMNDLTTHVLIAGATGAGKSVTGNIFVEELLENKIPVVVFDPTGQWTGFMRPCTDPKVLKYYRMHGLSPREARFYPGNIIEITDPETKVDLRKYMNPGEITVFLLSKLKPGDYDKAITNLINTIFEQGWEESTQLKLVVVFDEVHRLLERYGGIGGYVALERACREFRKWGIGLIMISQVLADFKEAIKGNVLTEIQMHTKSIGDLRRIENKYGLDFAKKVAKEEVGIGMIQNPKYNKGVPWFISFRPPLHMPHKLPAEELEMYRRYNIEIEKIELEIEKLKKEGKDVSDLEIDLKLAKEKIKQGMFRMAEIYIESLKSKLGV
jgi:hypothetical protein